MAPGTGTLPNGATLTINPKNLFANGEISTTVTISNINVGGTPVPNGTLVAVTAAPALNLTSAGGMISGPSVGTSVDTRFLLFETEGASVTLFYTPPEADWLTPGATANGIIQVASVDSDTRPANLILQDTATLYRLKTAGITANPATLPADGSSQSTVEVVVRDNSNNLVPDGTEIGITVAPVFVANSAGGTIQGGTQSGADSRVSIFSTTNGRFSVVYQSPNSRGPGYAVIQAVTVNNQGAPTGLINSITINLSKYPPAKPGALRLLAPQRGLIAIGKESNPPSSPFVKRGKSFPSLWKREVGRDFSKEMHIPENVKLWESPGRAGGLPNC